MERRGTSTRRQSPPQKTQRTCPDSSLMASFVLNSLLDDSCRRLLHFWFYRVPGGHAVGYCILAQARHRAGRPQCEPETAHGTDLAHGGAAHRGGAFARLGGDSSMEGGWYPQLAAGFDG